LFFDSIKKPFIPQKIEIINQTPTPAGSHCESTEEPIDTLEQY
jgi:hypothetical protein